MPAAKPPARTPARKPAPASAARKAVAKKPAARKAVAKKPVARKAVAAKKPAAKKPAARKAVGTRTPAARRQAAKTGPAAKKAVRRVASSPQARKAVKRATKGDRPYVFGLIVLGFVLLSMAWSPLRGLTAGSERIEQLTASRNELRKEVDRLEDRQDRLMDPQELELIAREEYGLVKPGEIPYVVVTPEADPQLRDQRERSTAPKPWHQRLWSAIRQLWE